VIYDLLILRDTSLFVSATEQKPRSSLNWMGEIATFSHKLLAPYTPYHALSAIHSGEMLGAEATRLVIARINHTLGEERQVIKVPMNVVTSETLGSTRTAELSVFPESV
jgi:hypothetical protein